MDFMFWWLVAFGAIETAIAGILADVGRTWWPNAALAGIFAIGLIWHENRLRERKAIEDMHRTEMTRRLRRIESLRQQQLDLDKQSRR